MVQIEYTRQITPDVIAGLRLYARLTGEAESSCEDSAIANWRYWFEANPNTDGFFAIAKNSDDVVGFRSLIPVSMYVRGRRMIAGKDEFFVVAPDFRRAVAQSPNLRLPEALYVGLRTWSYECGVEAHFDVAIPPVMALAAKYGATSLEFPCVRHSFPFEQLFTERKSHEKLNSLKLKGLVGLARVLRLWAHIRAPAGRGTTVREYSDFDQRSCLPREGRNEIVASDVESLRFRFPPERSVNLVLAPERNSREARFVFSKPAHDSECHLFYWVSDLSTDARLLSIAAAEMIRRCAAARARRLVIILPAAAAKASRQLRRLGFRVQPTTENVALHFRDPEYNSELSPEKWVFNSLHRRFYQDN